MSHYSLLTYFTSHISLIKVHFLKTILIILIYCFPFRIYGSEQETIIPDNIDADSIMRKVIRNSDMYGGYVKEYDAQVYVKGTSEVLKRNILTLFAPDYFFIDKKKDQTILEAITQVHYNAPNLFSQEIKAISGTIRNIKEVQTRAMRFLNVNIYNPASYNNEILIPISTEAFKYYQFSFLSSKDTLETKILTIKIEPKINSQKLIQGTISVVSDSWNISNMDISGKRGFLNFRANIDFGISDKEFLLPVEANLFFSMKLLGNHIENHYTSKVEYTSILKYEDKSKRQQLGYDLTEYFDVKLDSLPVVKDSAFWSKNRPFPLTDSEKAIYENNKKKPKEQIDTLSFDKKQTWNLTKNLISSKRFDFIQSDFRYSGLINPLKLAYSELDGLVYWQQLKLDHNFESGRAIAFEPDIGFVFKRNEIFFKLPINWLYQPRHIGELSLSIGNGNNSYNSNIIDKINEELKDSIINFDDLDLKYYKHHYISLKNSYELFNGFMSNIGIDYHLYKPVTSSGGYSMKSGIELSEGLPDNNYSSFTPVVGFTYTPKQYYRTINKRKEYVGANFPTLSVEYARGIPDILSSNSDYERIEGDIQQLIPIGLIRSFRYYVGGGMFTNAQSIYFADFTKFSKRNFPNSWNDQIGGVFHLLDSKWYNASNFYIQAHFMYESPFLLLHFVKGISKEVIRERVYLGQLYLPALPSHTEVGYAVGNYIFSAGVFAGFERGRYNNFGIKFNFEIGQ